MVADLALLSAFLVGFLGSVHCIGMCGGIVGTLTMGVPSVVRASPVRMFPYFFTYNAGRITSYAVAGAVVGYLGAQAAGLFPVERVQTVGRIISGAFMIVLGLYLGGWWAGLARLEKIGAYLWRAVEPWGRRLMPVRNPVHALGLGLVWGWLPCGLVYSALAFALVAGSAEAGAARMAAFGLGTLPMLLAMGAAAAWLGGVARKPLARWIVGGVIILFGVVTLVVPGAHGGHSGHVSEGVSAARTLKL